MGACYLIMKDKWKCKNPIICEFSKSFVKDYSIPGHHKKLHYFQHLTTFLYIDYSNPESQKTYLVKVYRKQPNEP